MERNVPNMLGAMTGMKLPEAQELQFGIFIRVRE